MINVLLAADAGPAHIAVQFRRRIHGSARAVTNRAIGRLCDVFRMLVRDSRIRAGIRACSSPAPTSPSKPDNPAPRACSTPPRADSRDRRVGARANRRRASAAIHLAPRSRRLSGMSPRVTARAASKTPTTARSRRPTPPAIRSRSSMRFSVRLTESRSAVAWRRRGYHDRAGDQNERCADQLSQHARGAGVVLDPRTGAVLGDCQRAQLRPQRARCEIPVAQSPTGRARCSIARSTDSIHRVRRFKSLRPVRRSKPAPSRWIRTSKIPAIFTSATSRCTITRAKLPAMPISPAHSRFRATSTSRRSR